MELRLMLPDRVFVHEQGVSRIVAESCSGSFGLLEHRRDCVAALVPGILVYETKAGGEVCIAIDEGVLVKAGKQVRVSVRNAIGGADLDELRATIEREFLELDDEQRMLRTALAKLELGFMHRLAMFGHD